MNKISLLLADVDGTLVDSKKRLTERAKEAVKKLSEVNIRFAITSGRPPRGMKMIAEQIKLSAPIAAFNGGMMVEGADMKVIDSKTLDGEIARAVAKQIDDLGLDVWVYAGTDWYLRNANAPHREKEEHTVQFPPKVVKDFEEAFRTGVAKIVGVSDNLELTAKAESEIRKEFEEGLHLKQSSPSRDLHHTVSAARSQPYYLDVTHPDANKGAVVDTLCHLYQLPNEEIATIGDMPNDVLMFKKSGFSIAMGQSSDEVKKQANEVTDGMDEEGFAKAIERFLLPQH